MKEASPEGQVIIPAFSAEPSEMQNRRILPREVDSKVIGRMVARIEELKEQDLSGTHLIYSWAARRIPPLKQRPHLLCEYSGNSDPSRTTNVEWSEKAFSQDLLMWTKVDPLPLFEEEPRAHSLAFPASPVSFPFTRPVSLPFTVIPFS